MNLKGLAHLFEEDLYCFDTPVVVVLARAWESYHEEDQTLLKKILSSVGMDLNAVQIIVQPMVDLNSLLIYSPGKVLVFGSETSEPIAPYQEVAVQSFMAVKADDLNLLDEQKKKNLWLTLRKMFGIGVVV